MYIYSLVLVRHSLFKVPSAFVRLVIVLTVVNGQLSIVISLQVVISKEMICLY